MAFGIGPGCRAVIAPPGRPVGLLSGWRDRMRGWPVLWRLAPRAGWVMLPGGTVYLGSRAEGGRALREVTLPSFAIRRCEVTAAEYAGYLNTATNTEPHPQFRGAPGRRRPRYGQARRPVAYVSYEDAQGFCRWLSGRLDVRVRLPTEDEWEYAARGGIDGARYPWGWCGPRGKAGFDCSGSGRVGRFPPNGFGLHDVAGNVYEWCAGRDGNAAVARGGAWPERDPDRLRVFHRERFDPGYRDADVGFRVVAEWP